MSDATYAALQDAIRAHAADMNGADGLFLTDWHVVAATTGVDPDSTGYVYATSDTAPHGWLGLLYRAIYRAQHDWDRVD